MPAAALAFDVIPSGCLIGADIHGIDLSRPLADDAVQALKAAWSEHLVLRIREQKLGDRELVEFSRRLGTLDTAPPRSATRRFDTDVPDYVLTVSNVLEGGEPIGELGDAEAKWHQDMTYRPKPPAGAVLYALELPPVGGNTQFCDLYRAYDTLPPGLQARVDTLHCIHDASLDSAGRPRAGYQPTTDPRSAQGPTHPLVQVHPRTGRKHLYLGRRPFAYIPGLALEDSEALLETLWSHATRPEFTWTQEWRLGDVVIWDNRCTMHRRDSFDPASRRVLHRTQLAQA